MLITASGERAGTISGGCLEAEVSRKIRWLTQDGATVQEYRSSFDDDNYGVPYGLGCGGRIWILMESGVAVDEVVRAHLRAFEDRTPSVLVSTIAGNFLHSTTVLSHDELDGNSGCDQDRLDCARRSIDERRCVAAEVTGDAIPEFVCMPVLPPPRLHIFGAGDDAQPIVRFADELGWEVFVADGRSHLLRPDRFPKAKRLVTLEYEAANSAYGSIRLVTKPFVEEGDRAVILTHSYEQDRAVLKELLPAPLEYLGILGPLHRTTRIVDEIKDELGFSRGECLSRLHAPIGLPIGSGDPAVIALSIVAEIQSVAANKAQFARGTAGEKPSGKDSRAA